MKPDCNSDYEAMDAFAAALLRFEDSIPLEGLERSLRELTISDSYIDRESTFRTQSYSRTSLHRGAKFEVLLLCWESGQRSLIHDHIGSNCAFKVLRGTATETRYEMTSEGHVVAGGSCELPQGTVRASHDEDIHQVSNDLRDGSRLVTLHIYSPPLDEMNSFSLAGSGDESRNRVREELLASTGE